MYNAKELKLNIHNTQLDYITFGGDGHIETAYGTACTLLRLMNCSSIHEAVYSHNTNEMHAVDDKNTLAGVKSIIEFFDEEK